MAKPQIFDTSVLIPWLRNKSYDNLVTASFESHRFLLCTVVWMELYAGTRSKNDKRDLDRILQSLSDIGRIVSPCQEDFYLAGQIIAYYARKYGAIQPRDHANDILVTLCAWRAKVELITENREHMETWQNILKRSNKRLDLKIVAR